MAKHASEIRPGPALGRLHLGVFLPSRPSSFRTRGKPTSTFGPPRKQTTTERGYGWVWQQLRRMVLRDEPLCRFCAEVGIVEPAAEVDHIDGDSHNNERSNLRPLCRPCHLRRTAEDQAFGKMQWRPEWLLPALAPLTIVCGAPGSGKSTYVRERAGGGDLVIDLDDIVAQLSGRVGHDWSRARWLRPAMRMRNEMLGDLGRQAGRWPGAWLVLSEPQAERRQWWVDKVEPLSIVVMETPAATCVLRVRGEADRDVPATEVAIAEWWQRYSRRAGDEVVRP